MEELSKTDLKVFFLSFYENYPKKTDLFELFKHKEINFTDCWNNKIISVYKIRRYKPTNFKKLYKKLFVIKKQYKKVSRSHWIISSVNSTNSLNISSTSSYLLRTLNNLQLYKYHKIPKYKNFYLKGFTFEKEKIFNKKKKFLDNTTLYSYSCFKLREKVLKQKKFERKFFC